jgi:membrane protein implicated in regulation of membrane protease activity
MVNVEATPLETAAWVLAAIVLVPVALSPAGWLVGAALAVAVLVSYYGGRYGLKRHRERGGNRDRVADLRQRGGGR